MSEKKIEKRATSEMVWTVRNPWTGKLYGFERQEWKAERKKRSLKMKWEIPTVVRLEPEEGLHKELTADQ